MNKKTTRLSSIALALMMVLMVALTLVPVSAAGAATGVVMEVPDGTSADAKDSNNVVVVPDGTTAGTGKDTTFTLKVVDYDYTGTEEYDGLYMELLNPKDEVVSGYAVSNQHKMTKIDSKTYTYTMTIKFDDKAFYNETTAGSGTYDDPIIGLYKIKVYPYKGSSHLTTGTHTLGAFYFAILSASGSEMAEGELAEPAPGDEAKEGYIQDDTNSKHMARPEGFIVNTVTVNNTNWTTAASASDAKVIVMNPIDGSRLWIAKAGDVPSAGKEAKYVIPKDAADGKVYKFPILAIEGENAQTTCEVAYSVAENTGLTGDLAEEVTIDAKGPTVEGALISNDKLKGRLWKDGFVLRSSALSASMDASILQTKEIKDSGIGYDVAYALFENKYHSSLNFGKNDTVANGGTQLSAAGVPSVDTYYDEIENISMVHQYLVSDSNTPASLTVYDTNLLDKEFNVYVIAKDKIGNETKASVGTYKFYGDYAQIDPLRVEAQNVLEMYVGQVLTKDDIARRNVKVYAGNDASFPDNWFWSVSLASEKLLDFDPATETITAKQAGDAYINAKAFDNYDGESINESDYIKVVITAEPTVKSISLNNTTATIKAGATQQLTATVDPSGVAVTWETSNKAIATVDANGLVTGVADGTAVIYAKAGAQVALCTVTVQGDVVATGISLNKTANTMVVGTSETLFATTTPAGAPVTWNTSNAAVATVDNAGKVTAMTAGTATITATSGSYSATCVVTVEGIAETLEPNQWYTDDMGNIYYSNEHSQLTVGWKKIGGYWYLFDYSTAVMKKGWAKDAGTWYYLQSDGKMKTGWLKDGSTWYYLQASGAMKTGWLKDGGVWYYLKDSGAMATGWVKVSGIWYYLQGSGAMKEGWLLESGVWYYLTPSSGAMLANGTYTVEGRKSQFAASGRWLGYV